MRRLLLVLAATGAWSTVLGGWSAADPMPDAAARPELAKIEAVLEAQRQEQHIPGLAFAVVQDDQVVYRKALGLRDVERRLPVTADTVFPIGSCTKAFTSMAVAIGQDQGKLSLDDPPRKFLPYFRMADPEADAQVTLRDMLSHRTGLKAYADLAAEPAVLSREEYVRAATAAKPTAKFRAAFQYSNAMYAAVGEILGKANGSTWERVIETQIFRPLGMASSFTRARDAARAADHATGYVYVAGSRSWRPTPPPASLDALAPAGNIASTADDMAQWLRLLTGGGSFGGQRLVSAARFRDLTSAQIPVDAAKSYALGWVLYDWRGLRVVEHNGGSDGISALVSFIPERHAGFVFLANTSPNFMTRIGNAGKILWPLILGAEAPADVPPAAAKAPAEAPPAGAAAPAAPAAAAAPAAMGDLPPVDDLLARMVRAAGGERTLSRHTSLTLHARKSYDNHGVTARLTVRAEAPSRRDEDEVWTAAGRQIGRLRIYFDGRHGGQETTFGQDSVNGERENDQARRDDDFHPLLDLKQLYREVRVERRAPVGGEETYVLLLTPAAGKPVRLYVSTRTALPVEREAEGASARFADYRAVDGELVPFHTTIQDGLGETTILVEDARFNTPIPDSAFAPARRNP